MKDDCREYVKRDMQKKFITYRHNLFVTPVPEIPYSMEISRISGGSSVVVSEGGTCVVKVRSPDVAGFPAASTELTR